MASTTQSDEPRQHLQVGAIYRHKSKNIIRLHSIRKNYCVYVYVSQRNQQSSMHGSVTVSPEETYLTLISYLPHLQSKIG
jgi:catabolite regulation protein CreA